MDYRFGGYIMRMIAVSALKDGMVIGDNVNVGGKTVIKRGSSVDNVLRRQLEVYKVMSINIMEPEDFADSYYEKIRLSRDFSEFEANYAANLMAYKVAVDSFILKKVPFRLNDLKAIADHLVTDSMMGSTLFAYLYLHVPAEDDLTYAHGLNVALICKIVARWLKLTSEETDTLVLCGFLYDVGKFMIPNEIIWKPDKLNKMEFDLVKTHAYYGYHLLKNYSKNVNDHVLNATLQHHERTDGGGYPQGLKDQEIDKYAKIMSILDVYEAMTSARSYREPKCPYTVVEIMKRDGFQNYDAGYLMLFLGKIVEELIGTKVRLSDGSEGEVVLNNKTDLARPIVKCGDQVIDLSKQRTLSIEAIV